MKGFTRFLLILIVLAVAGGAVFLSAWEIPAPTAQVEKEIPDDRFPR
ncbi:MAG: hypothetical protein H6907_02955 [Hyphomicrobiales bacterium]|nr:hypothetical protein [Hyphomicrobiales bacterium]MCP5370665.1 hypothetical protein [Hyphomicrobiales bacterium]